MDFAAPMLPESGPGPGGSGVMWQEVTGVELTRRKGIGFGYLRDVIVTGIVTASRVVVVEIIRFV